MPMRLLSSISSVPLAPRAPRTSQIISLTAVASLLGACTFGLGNYAAGDEVKPPPDTDASGGELAVPDTDASPEPPPEQPVADGSPPRSSPDGGDGGPCRNNEISACTTPNGGDGGERCVGERRCVQGVWGACDVPLRCPATWPAPPGPGVCQNIDLKGTSPARWTENPAMGAPATLWSLTRKTPFELYGLHDSFCFIPKSTGNCYSTSTTAVRVECTNSNLKLSGNDFENGSIHNKEFCVTNPGGSCSVIDYHDSRWQPNSATVNCERWFVAAHWRVTAAPRCSW